MPQPIVVLETFLQDSSAVPDEITAQLTFNSSAGTAYTYDTTGLSAGDDLRFALQADATSLATGHYDYSVKLTADMDSTLVDHVYDGATDIVNRGASTYPFGRGWQLAGLDQLVIGSGGVSWVQDDGDALWFAEDGGGGFEPAAGDVTFSTLIENVDDTFTLTDKHGIEMNFDSDGLLTSRVDRNGNTVAYTYTSGLLTGITDPFDRDITLSYTSGRLTSITDFASRTATLAYDGSGRLTSITQPDPDGGGAQSSPVTEFAYDATTHQLTTVTNPLGNKTAFERNDAGLLARLTAADPDGGGSQTSPVTTFGYDPSGNLVYKTTPRGYSSTRTYTSFNLVATSTDETGNVTSFTYDTAGNMTQMTDPADNDWSFT